MNNYWDTNKNNVKKSSVKGYVLVFLIIFAFFGGWHFGKGRAYASNESSRPTALVGVGSQARADLEEVEFQLFWDVWENIQESYINQPVNELDLFYGAMRGLVRSLDDPYSDFFEPEIAESFNEALEGSFGGIGVEIGKRNDRIVVITPLKDSPGEKAGLKPGDTIVFIEDTDAFDMSLDEAVSLIRGEPGTTITLTVLSKEDEEPHDVVVTRAQIENIGMRWEYTDDNIAIVTLSSFDQDTQSLMNELISEIEKKNIDKLVVDMRNNPGGLLEMAIEVASEWVEDGIIVRERDNNGEERLHNARGRARLSDMETIVLINEGSASASEIVAGALQDYAKATLIGMTTFGKGSVQKYETFPDGSALKLTIAKWFTPQEQKIDENGITPDIEIDLTEDDFNNERDPQLDRALELLRD